VAPGEQWALLMARKQNDQKALFYFGTSATHPRRGINFTDLYREHSLN
jgi:hypothetical protein